MKIAIIGAGISGMAAAKLLGKEHNVTVFERSVSAGGIARPRLVDGISYHLTGGHCFNSKYEEVRDFVFNEILPLDNWHKVTRKAEIKYKDHLIPYPIEYSIREIHKHYPEIAEKIVDEFVSAGSSGDPKNLDEWFRATFGNTLAEEYFIPYNKKIWNNNPVDMSHTWVQDKLPIPDKSSFIAALFSDKKDKMPHAEFYYPNTNTTLSFIEALAKGLSISYGCDITSIQSLPAGEGYLLNSEHHFDKIISTVPLNLLPTLLHNCDETVLDAAQKLKYNRVTTMLWESQSTDKTWTYIPSENEIFHRYIHIGSFFKPRKNFTITEAVGLVTESEMIDCGSKDPFLMRPVDYHVSDHAYVIFDQNYHTSVRKIISYMDEIGIHTLGRFGQWDYFNMDICIKEAMKLTKIIELEGK